MWETKITINENLKGHKKLIDLDNMDEYYVAVNTPIIPLNIYINNILDYIVEKGIKEGVLFGEDLHSTIYYRDIRKDLGLGEVCEFSEDIIDCLRYCASKREEIISCHFYNYSVNVIIHQAYIKKIKKNLKKKEKKKLSRSIANKTLQKYNLSEFRFPDIIQMTTDLLRVKMDLVIDEYPEYKFIIRRIQNAIYEIEDLVSLFMIDRNTFWEYFVKSYNNRGEDIYNDYKYEDLIFNQFGFESEFFNNNIIVDTDYIPVVEQLHNLGKIVVLATLPHQNVNKYNGLYDQHIKISDKILQKCVADTEESKKE